MNSIDEAKAYQWAFDTRPEDVNPKGFMFSVGIFQWIPKASGKGFKKSKTIRVMGYCMEPASVFEKATELCKLFNEKSVRAEEPPRWVQKQYLVPKPASLVLQPFDEWVKNRNRPPQPGMYLERFSNDLSGSKVRAVRLRVMKKILIPEGYVKTEGGTYIREFGNQIHLIDFQPNKYGHQYTINLGFHYSFLPGFFRAARGEPKEFHILDFAVRTRMQSLLLGADVWFTYGHDLTTLAAVFEQNATTCLRLFEQYALEWADPRYWLDQDCTKSLKWDMHHLPLFQYCIALHLGMRSTAEQFLIELKKSVELAPSAEHADYRKRNYNRIVRQLGDRRFKI